MRTNFNQNRLRPRAVFLTLLLIVGGGLVVWSSWTTRAGEVSRPVLSAPGEATPTTDPTLLGLEAPPDAPSEPATTRVTPVDERVLRVSCQRRSNGEALPGIRLYRDEESIAGPSDAEGVLEVRAAPAGPLMLWAEGWLPVAVRGEALPDVVAFDAVGASLELRLLNATPQHRLLRSVLQPRGRDALSPGPWLPALGKRASDIWIAERVPPGAYDLYVWIIFPDGEPRPFSHQAFEIKAAERTLLTIDMAVPRDPEDFESDN